MQDITPVIYDNDLINDIKSIDIAVGMECKRRMDELANYIVLVENPKTIYDETARIMLFAKLSYGLRKSGEGYAWAMRKVNEAAIKKKETESSAALDEISNWVKKRREDDSKFKPTDKDKTHFIYTIDSVKVAYRLVAILESMAENFLIIRQEFTQAISTLRAMYYGQRDSTYMSSAASTEPSWKE
jgi:alpha-L-arabinofuranosidase